MAANIQIEQGIVLPSRYEESEASKTLRATLSGIATGESFVADKYQHSFTVRKIAKQLGIKVSIRSMGKDRIRVWRTA